jgi:hypothetical protein
VNRNETGVGAFVASLRSAAPALAGVVPSSRDMLFATIDSALADAEKF